MTHQPKKAAKVKKPNQRIFLSLGFDTAEQHALIKRAAQLEGRSLNNYIRRAAVAAALRDLQLQLPIGDQDSQ
jgi:uncharacterized protein (DUF1778 family)